MPSSWLPAFQVGANIASDKANRALRMQQLQSEAAHRQAMERNAAQMLQLRLEQHDMIVQRQADTAKAFGKYQAMTQPKVVVPNFDGTPIEIDNPMQVPEGTAAIQAFLPLAKDPQQALDIASKGALMNERQAAGESLTLQRASSTKLNEARLKQVEARTTEIQKGKPGAQPEWVESILFLEDRLGHKLSPEVIEDIYSIKSGTKPRAGTQRVPSEGEFVSKHIEKVMEQNVIKEESTVDSFFNRGGPKTTTKYRRPKTLEEGESVLKEQYQRLFAPEPKAAAPTTEAQGGNELIYVLDPTGKKVKIRQRDLERALQRGFKEFEG